MVMSDFGGFGKAGQKNVEKSKNMTKYIHDCLIIYEAVTINFQKIV